MRSLHADLLPLRMLAYFERTGLPEQPEAILHYALHAYIAYRLSHVSTVKCTRSSPGLQTQAIRRAHTTPGKRNARTYILPTTLCVRPVLFSQVPGWSAQRSPVPFRLACDCSNMYTFVLSLVFNALFFALGARALALPEPPTQVSPMLALPA